MLRKINLRRTLGCFESGKKFPSAVIHEVGDVSSAEVCQRLCAHHPGCEYATFRISSDACLLQRAEAVRDVVSSPDHVVAPASCHDGVLADVYLQGQDIGGGAIRKVSSALACNQLCKDK